jgi:hypothetical protein
MIDTPECDKQLAVKEDAQVIGEFIEWLRGERDCVIAEYTGNPKYSGRYELFPINDSIEQLLADYYKIDLNKVEKERRKLLDLQRELNWSHQLLEVLG